MSTTRSHRADPGPFHFVIIKPSHDDADGYPIQWLRSAIPSNTLAGLNRRAEDARDRQAIGPNVEIRIHTYDETNRRVRPDDRGARPLPRDPRRRGRARPQGRDDAIREEIAHTVTAE